MVTLMAAFQAARPDSGLFARKGEAAPVADASRSKVQTFSDRRILVDPSRYPTPSRPAGGSAKPPLSFLIVRRKAPCAAPDQTEAAAPVAAQRNEFALKLLHPQPSPVPTPPAPTPDVKPPAPRRRALTLRLPVDDFEAFRQTAANRQASYQSLLAPLVLEFLEKSVRRSDRQDD